MMRLLRTQWLVALTSLLGFGALLYPFFLSEIPPDGTQAQAAPLLIVLLIPLLLGIIVVDVIHQQINARVIAVLGMLVAINAVLRLPAGPADSPTFFFLVILVGYVYGGRFGFLLGNLSLVVSALITGGVGPWMPFQMLIMGWMGGGAAWINGLRERLGLPRGGRGEIVLLAGYGWLWGFIFGLLMNLTFWPFASSETAISWEPGLGLAETLRRYQAFYLLTSLTWDATRALFNVLFIAAFGKPILKVLRRFGQRLHYQHQDSLAKTAR